MSVFDKLYDNISSRKHAEKDFEEYKPGRNGRIDRCVDFFAKGVLRDGEGISMVDLGGAIGDLGSALQNRFLMRYVIDISEVPFDAARAKGNICYKSNIDEDGIPLDDGTVDFVAALDVIEHVVDPEKMIRESFRVLKPGGQLYINTPNIMFWRHINHLLTTRRFPHTSGDKEVFHGGHTAFFTRCDIMDMCGMFKLVRYLKDVSTRDPVPQHISESILNIARNANSLFDDLEYPDVLIVAEK